MTSARLEAEETTTAAKKQIPSFHLEDARIVMAKSHLINRIEPECGVLWRSASVVRGGEIMSSLGAGRARPPARRRRFWPRGTPDTVRLDSDRVAINLRRNTPQNWAHFLNNHLPLTFHFAEEHGLGSERLLAILPNNTPSYILAAAELFGLEVMKTDAPVEGTILSFDVSPWQGARSIRHEWARTEWPRGRVRQLLAEGSPTSLPRRPFLSRRDTRRIANGGEVEVVVRARGYETVYAEDLSVPDQFRLILQAEEIVAVHGAALAPLLYAGGEDIPVPRRVIELMPCGHMTEVYRVMAAQVGCDWIGVQGRLKPSYVRPSYRFGSGFTKYSLDDFEVDPEALELAFAMTEEGDRA
ncbi:DUF563 domain-containing protein [Jannaschia sp. W003]|uniref:glycosyltransferase family 61 protein n=1 Tax=Jannaschia sp. W003 TaxID=2867012 RepID=UPI0021A82EED|nr:glycosyltransferase family 61 protein [Jannaschia sp. W003]UWQ23182.1 glycosyltransferase family 61 protein [Jannaschia sp. W003]